MANVPERDDKRERKREINKLMRKAYPACERGYRKVTEELRYRREERTR